MRWLLLAALLVLPAAGAQVPDASIPPNPAPQNPLAPPPSPFDASAWAPGEAPRVVWSGGYLRPRASLAADTTARDPDVALRRSLIAPGWGQLYNGDRYKLPFVWGGLAALGGLAVRNEREYRRMQRVVRYAEFPDDYPENADDAAEYIAAGLIECQTNDCASDNRTAPLIELRNSFRRSRDLFVVGVGLWYALTAVDAYVSAHLSDFDADPDFRLTLDPIPSAPTLRLNVRF